jgi:hypothetical protein
MSETAHRPAGQVARDGLCGPRVLSVPGPASALLNCRPMAVQVSGTDAVGRPSPARSHPDVEPRTC